ncbi:MAG: HD domain-containing protein [Lachnospiraceae bacterium]|nr:HD domain-containing protein [Lachnospiraceae bacterium]
MMDFFIAAKTQIVCLMTLLYVGYLYLKDGNHLDKISGKNHCNVYYDWMLVCAEISVLLDGVTAYTAAHYKNVSSWLNGELHFVFYVSLMLFATFYFFYWLSVSGRLSEDITRRMIYYLPCVIGMYLCAINMRSVRFVEGKRVTYSMGFSVYVCFSVVALYLLFTLVVFFRNLHVIKANKRSSLITGIVFAYAIMMVQLFLPEVLVSCFATTLITLSVYLCMENPSVKMVEVYHEEMLMGFATLLEKKDGGTGGHIRRTSEYAVIIAKELSKLPKHKKHINREYLKSLRQAAPMHDIGKISIPDNILQKPGKLTDEEFAIMKTHSAEGAKIIKETFSHLVDDGEDRMAYKVALNHHEKWNGRGYPNGLKEEEIPLCARIMAVADVFDAVSAKRCYRDAMPLEKCFAIIYEGKGTDFDPEIVDAFFERQREIVKVYNRYRDEG